MSIQHKCDICGKTESRSNPVDNRCIVLKIPNYKKEYYNMYIDIRVEKSSDRDKIDDIVEKTKDPVFLEEQIKNRRVNRRGEILVEVENPEPYICTKCKKKIPIYLSNFDIKHS